MDIKAPLDRIRSEHERNPAEVQITPARVVTPPQPSPVTLTQDGVAEARPSLPRGPSSSAHSAGARDVVALQRVNNAVADGGLDEVQFQKQLNAMAAEGLTPAGQQRMISYLEGRKLTPEAMCGAAKHVRELLFDHETPVGPLRRFFNRKGVKLFENDKVDSPHVLDRKAFKELMSSVASDGVVSKAEARRIMATLSGVVDRKDLQAAKWEIERRLMDGSLRFEGSDPAQGTVGPYQAQLDRMFDDKLGGELNIKAFRARVQRARKDGFPPEQMAELRAIMEKSRKHPDALFKAQEALERAFAEANGTATRKARKAERTIAYLERKLQQASPEQAASLRAQIDELRAQLPQAQASCRQQANRLNAAQSEVRGWVSPLVEGKLNKKVERDRIRRQVASGQITRAQAYGMMAAVTCSTTMVEYAEHTLSMMLQLSVAPTLMQLLEAWEKKMEELREASRAEDARDAARFMEEQQLERLEEATRQVEVLAEKVCLLHTSTAARHALPKAATASEADQLGNDEARTAGLAQQL